MQEYRGFYKLYRAQGLGSKLLERVIYDIVCILSRDYIP